MLEELFRDRLMRGERIVWTGRPGQGIVLTARDAFLIPFSLAWCGFAIFWTFGATSAKAPGFFTLWGLMFVGIGLYFVFGRFLVDAWLRRNMAYAVTNQRVMILRTGLSARFIAMDIGRLPALELREGSRGRGTIRFGTGENYGNRGTAGWSPTTDAVPQFIAIDDVRDVFSLLQQRSRTLPDQASVFIGTK